ncbi:T9SS type A sorting domain-containing protein, partial [Candidatus Dojkabacteria bacterium]|nr:T9SS type A sorting domain-containing protein [Candidatus Dojkabacteria bacterium]
NMVDLWSDRHFKDVDIKMGVSYKTSGVNVNPTTDDQKWWVSYSFYREDGSMIGEKKFELDQTTASTSGWIEDTTTVGEIILPEDSYTTIIRFVGGKDATGTVWTDNYVFVGRAGGWAGQDWNTQLGVPTGWFYWLPPIGGNDGVLDSGYENTIITDEAAYYGKNSLKFDIPKGSRDGFVGTRKFAIDGAGTSSLSKTSGESKDITSLKDVMPGDVIRISIWIKGENLEPDSAAAVGDSWSVALTPMFHNTVGNNAGFGDFWASDIPLVFPKTSSFDWMQFYVDVTVQEGAKALSIRLHPLGRFQGTVYMDALEIKKIGSEITGVENQVLPVDYALFQNYPNPFNPTTLISYALPRSGSVTLKIYDMLGREVKTLVNAEQNSGVNTVQWNGDNNSGSRVSSGTYIYMIKAGEFTQAKKMILLK